MRPYYIQAHKLFTDPLLNIVFNTNNSPFWYRGYYQAGKKEEIVDRTLNFYEVKTIVTGHTPIDRITPFFDGKGDQRKYRSYL